MRYVSIHSLKENDVLGLPIYNADGKVLVNSDIKLTKRIIERLIALGINDVCVNDEISDGIDAYDSISQKIKTKSIKHLQDFNLDKAMKDACKIVEELKYHTDIYEYFNTKTFDNYTYEHCIAVSVYATMMGFACGYNEKQCQNLAVAGILHDIGKKCIDSNILHKPAKLTVDEFEQVKKHPGYGFNMVRENHMISSTVKTSIFEHHENEDGSGYPRGLKGDEIYKFAKIIHIVDVYDALISKRPYKEPMKPKDAIDYIIEKTGTMFDEYYVDIFIQIIPAYPRGSIVELSDGRKAIVIKNYRGDIYRPMVRTLDTKEIIYLQKTPDLYINRQDVD